jgi:hypothetical protein
MAWVVLPMLSCIAAAASEKRAFANFAGVWEYQGKIAAHGESQDMQFRYSIFQNGRRVCGCLERNGAGSTRVEYYAFKGVAHPGYADFWMNAGSPADANYSPSYPFVADDAFRLKKDGRALVIGHPVRKRENGRKSSVFAMDERIVYLPAFALKLQPRLPLAESCDYEEEGAGRVFLDQCLSDPVADE